MAKQILFDPRVRIYDAKLLFRIDVKVISALPVEKGVLGIEYLEAARYVVVLEPKEVSFSKSKLFLLSVVHYPLHILSSKIAILHQCRNKEYP